jgi:sugar O-acyltransferase (sialic acid O-acetyltransferase NeuD family)
MIKTKKLILFGTSEITQIANMYFENDSEYEVVAFTVDRDYCKESEFEQKPLIPFDEIESVYPPTDYEMFIAISYAQMNRLRQQKFEEAVAKGYSLATYISSKCSYLSQFKPGKNVFIFEDNTIQPYVKIEDNVTIWSGNHIGHHSTIHSHNFISSHVVISGHCTIKSNCFLGVNSTLAHKVILAEGTLLGAGVVMSKHSHPDSVYVAPKPILLEKKSFDIKL